MVSSWWFLLTATDPTFVDSDSAPVARTVATANTIHAPMPPLPPVEQWQGQTRVVCHMNLDIRQDGTVQRAIASGCATAFKKQAIETTKTWTFEPLLGVLQEPVRTTYAFDVTYRRADRPVRAVETEGPIEPQLPTPPRLLQWALKVEFSCPTVVRVDAEGKVEDVAVNGCTTELSRSIATAARQWRFPLQHNDAGEPIATLYPVTVTFRSTDLTEQALAVDIPGLMTIPLANAWQGELPDAPTGVVHLDEPLPRDPAWQPRLKSEPEGLFDWIQETGLESVVFQHYLLVTVNKRGRVADVAYLDGPPELEAYVSHMVRAMRFDRTEIDHSDDVRFVLPVPVRFKP